MAKQRQSVLDIDKRIGALSEFEKKATDAANKLYDLQALTEEEIRIKYKSIESEKARNEQLKKDQEAASNEKKKADAKLKKEQDELKKEVGESTDKFKELAENLRDFDFQVKKTGNAFDNLLGPGGGKAYTNFFQQLTEESATIVREIDEKKKSLEEDLSKEAREKVLAELKEKEFQLGHYEKITESLMKTTKDFQEIGTLSGRTKIDFGERQRRLDELTDGKGVKYTPGGKVSKSQKNAGLIASTLAEFEAEDALVAVNKQFQDSVGYAEGLKDNMISFADKIPFIGGMMKDFINDEFEKAVQLAGADLAKSLANSEDGIKKAAAAQTLWNRITEMNPYVKIAAVILAIATAISMAVNYTRNLSSELGVSTKEAFKLQGTITAAGAALLFYGQSAKSISSELIDAFGNTERITTKNIVQIGRLATKLGAETKDIISIQKQLMDMTGASADSSAELIKNVGRLAAAEGVGAGNVIADIAANMATFAEFSTMGAEGLAEAAVQAAKVGASLSTVTTFAEKLLNFETSISSEFEAQVLTGKSLNLERARELALQGRMGELAEELKSTVGGLGELQSMNVVEKRAISAAIGVSVADLQKISRGEAIEQKKTQESLLQELINVNKKGFAGNQEAFGKSDSSFQNYLNYGT